MWLFNQISCLWIRSVDDLYVTTRSVCPTELRSQSFIRSSTYLFHKVSHHNPFIFIIVLLKDLPHNSFWSFIVNSSLNLQLIVCKIYEVFNENRYFNKRGWYTIFFFLKGGNELVRHPHSLPNDFTCDIRFFETQKSVWSRSRVHITI